MSMQLAVMAQDRAAGGLERRKLRTRSGETFTASLAVSPSGSSYRVVLRFKNGGTTIQRPVGTIAAESHFEALRAGWQKVRDDKVIEQEGWSWVSQ